MGHTTIHPRTKAEMGLALIKEALLDYLEDHPSGARNSELAEQLNLHSNHESNQVDYLSYSVLGLLLETGHVTKVRQDGKTFYVRWR